MKKDKTVVPNTNEDEELEAMLEKKSKSSPISIVINVILVIAIILAAFCTYVSYTSTSGNGVPSIFGFRFFSIQTESMKPTLDPGDFIIDTKVSDPATLQVGDVITYWTVIDGERALNTHRISQISDGGSYRIFTTKGDNNPEDDGLTVHESYVVGKFKTKISGLGNVFDFLQTSKGFLIVVVIPVAIFFLFHLIQFFRVLFEYQNVKQRLAYEVERGKNEDIVEEELKKVDDQHESEKAELEAKLREKLKAELMAEMKGKGDAEASSDVKEAAEEVKETVEEKAAEVEEQVEEKAEEIKEDIENK